MLKSEQIERAPSYADEPFLSRRTYRDLYSGVCLIQEVPLINHFDKLFYVSVGCIGIANILKMLRKVYISLFPQILNCKTRLLNDSFSYHPVVMAHQWWLQKMTTKTIQKNRQLFSTALQGDLLDNIFLFLRFSFSDPNIGYILSRIGILLGKDQREHFCIMRKIHRSDFSKEKDFIAAQTRQRLQIRDLKRFAIQVHLVEEYEHVTQLLRIIEARVQRKRIFIGGSASTYDPLNEVEAKQFIHDLSKTLVKSGCKIITGFGLGVGDAVINGALDHIFSTKYRSRDRFLAMRPFPQFATGIKKQSEMWAEYRKSMIDEAGIAFFLFGNKVVNNEIVLADGLQKEFDLALNKGNPVVPVGFTGFSAKMLSTQLAKKPLIFHGKQKISSKISKNWKKRRRN